MLLAATGPEVYVSTMNTVLSGSYFYLKDTLNHLKCIKIKYYLEYNVIDSCAAILVNAERLDIYGAFKLEHGI